MYSLLVTAMKGLWNSPPAVFPLERAIREYSHADLKARFLPFTPDTYEELKLYPALFAYESGVEGHARVGWINRVRFKPPEIRIEYDFDPAIPPISTEDLRKLEWELEIQNGELYRTHWAIKDADLLAVLVEADLINLKAVRHAGDPRLTAAWLKPSPFVQIDAHPSVFKRPVGNQDSKLISVMMPFEQSMNGVYEAIKIAATENGMTCNRASDIWEESEIIQDVFSLIYRSAFVVCDFTKRNPNVFYEAGIAHTLGRQVIPIVQSLSDIPFDLQHHRAIEYLNNGEGLSALTKLSKRFSTLLSKQIG